MNLYAIIFLTLHVTTCVLCALVLLTFRGGERQAVGSYFSYLRMLALAMLSVVPQELLLIALRVLDIPTDCVHLFLSPLTGFFEACLMLLILQLRLHVPHRYLRRQQMMMMGFFMLALVHPLLYMLYRTSTDTPISFSSYMAFCSTLPCQKLDLLLDVAKAVVGIALLTYSVRSTRIILALRRKYLDKIHWERLHGTLLTIAAVVVLLVIDELVDVLPYFASLPLWSVVMVAVTIVVLNDKHRFCEMEEQCLALQMEHYGVKRKWDSQEDSPESPDQLYMRERAVVMRAIQDWTQREDKPFLAPKVTIAVMARDINIPVGVLRFYINWGFGKSFSEFITYLRNSNHLS